MMSLLPVGFLLLTLAGARPSDRAEGAVPAVTVGLSLTEFAPGLTERASIPASTLAPATVVFSGYLLPVDGPEDQVHAGR